MKRSNAGRAARERRERRRGCILSRERASAGSPRERSGARRHRGRHELRRRVPNTVLLSGGCVNVLCVDDMVEPVRSVIAERYPDLLAACDGLRDYAIGMMSPSWGGERYPEEGSPHEVLLLVVLSRSLNTYWAAVELARTGFGPQAAMLNRSLFEDMIDAHWMTVEPARAVQRFEEHHAHGRMLLANAVRQLKLLPPEEIPTFDAKERAALDDVFGKYGDRSWTGLGIYSRVKTVEHLWEPVEGGRETLDWYRQIVHREANQILHLSAFSMTGQVRERTETMLSVSLGPNDQYADKALIAAFWCLSQLISVVRQTFGFADEEVWREVFDSPLRHYRPVVEEI